MIDAELRGNDSDLANVSYALGAGEKGLVYASTQARCEKVANTLLGLAERDSYSPAAGLAQRLRELEAFIRQYVHTEYSLTDCVRYGIAFHYGNIPGSVRKAVEEYFDEGLLRFLVCTSTLLHGVNLPAKNLFLQNPTKGGAEPAGGATPITSFDFWNLAGRAGRLGRDFEGNVFLIDPSRWDADPVEGGRTQEIKPALQEAVVAKHERLMAFVGDRDHKSGEEQAMENSFVKLFNDARTNRLDETLGRLFPESMDPLRAQIAMLVSQAAQIIDVPTEITRRNINISPYRQQEMLDHLVTGVQENGPDQYIPLHPAGAFGNVYGSTIALFRRIHLYFEGRSPQDRTHLYFARLAIHWMRGDPFPRLIDDAYQYRLRSAPKTKLATMIRRVMEQVEQHLRFRYVKCTACYNDLVAEALRRTGHVGRIESIPQVSLYLELGASSQTMISLIQRPS